MHWRAVATISVASHDITAGGKEQKQTRGYHSHRKKLIAWSQRVKSFLSGGSKYRLFLATSVGGGGGEGGSRQRCHARKSSLQFRKFSQSYFLMNISWKMKFHLRSSLSLNMLAGALPFVHPVVVTCWKWGSKGQYLFSAFQKRRGKTSAVDEEEDEEGREEEEEGLRLLSLSLSKSINCRVFWRWQGCQGQMAAQPD